MFVVLLRESAVSRLSLFVLSHRLLHDDGHGDVPHVLGVGHGRRCRGCADLRATKADGLDQTGAGRHGRLHRRCRDPRRAEGDHHRIRCGWCHCGTVTPCDSGSEGQRSARAGLEGQRGSSRGDSHRVGDRGWCRCCR